MSTEVPLLAQLMGGASQQCMSYPSKKAGFRMALFKPQKIYEQVCQVQLVPVYIYIYVYVCWFRGTL